MDEIEATVSAIVSSCKANGVPVSETLAAFVARTVVNENLTQFRMDKDMTEEDRLELVRLATERLLERDSPSLETVKMQVSFDTAYVEQEALLEKTKGAKDAQLKDMVRAIVDMKPESSSDFESLTALYRLIFKYLLRHADAEASGDRNVEREIAAALESVFPRIGLKAFIAMPAEEKKAQLTELASIVLGIRLFNKEIGKGGAGIDDTVVLSQQEASALFYKLQAETEELSEACQQYTDVLIYAHHNRPEKVSDALLERWQEELSNRRQFLSYCQSLQEDVVRAVQAVDAHREAYLGEMEELKGLVGSRSSVPKEQVYPKFDALAALWLLLAAERRLVAAREAARLRLVLFKSSFVPSMTSEHMAAVRDGVMPTPEEEAERARETRGARPAAGGGGGGGGGGAGAGAGAGAEGEGTEAAQSVGGDGECVRLSIDSTPEFMQLPLEYQGYCPWTVVERRGLLLPGNPALGVVRYRNTFNVFVHEEALDAFMADPARYSDGVLEQARRSPALIHLLRLQEQFPTASLSKLLGSSVAGGAGGLAAGTHPLLGPVPATMKDAATETPTHFVEKNVDPNYDWNEWSLRRKALKLANLRKCRTVSTQTDSSHFRRDTETQHWAKLQHGTQTAVDHGTNPARKQVYLAGLRGEARPNGTAFARPEEGRPDDRVAMVDMTYEL